MKRRLVLLLFLLPEIFANAQTVSLTDTFFTASFKEEIFAFAKVQPRASKDWNIIAGMCNISKRERNPEDVRRMKKGVDSFMAIINGIKINDPVSSSKASRYIDQLNDFRDSSEYKKEYKILREFKGSGKVAPISAQTNLCKASGFSTWCPPNSCNWFIVSFHKDEIKLIDDRVKILKFIGKVNNPYKARLVLTSCRFGDSGSYPMDSIKIKYNKINGIFYFIERLRLSDCPIQNFDCLISVNSKGEVLLIDKIKVGEDGDCI